MYHTKSLFRLEKALFSSKVPKNLPKVFRLNALMEDRKLDIMKEDNRFLRKR